MVYPCTKCLTKYKAKKPNFYKIKQKGRKPSFSKTCKVCVKKTKLLNDEKKGAEFLIEKKEKNWLNNIKYREGLAYKNKVENYKPKRRKKRRDNHYYKKLGDIVKKMSDNLNKQTDFIIYNDERTNTRIRKVQIQKLRSISHCSN
jgi:hypothetical protein